MSPDRAAGEDEILDGIMADVLAMMAARTPEQVAADEAEIARQEIRYARPIRDRAIDAACRLDIPAVRAVMDEQRRLSVSDAPEDLRRLGETHRLVEDHPVTLPLADLLTCRDSGLPWLDTYIREQLWSWAWCADELGVSLAAYAKGQPLEVLAAIDGSRPWPDGWTPECARGRVAS